MNKGEKFVIGALAAGGVLAAEHSLQHGKEVQDALDAEGVRLEYHGTGDSGDQRRLLAESVLETTRKIEQAGARIESMAVTVHIDPATGSWVDLGSEGPMDAERDWSGMCSINLVVDGKSVQLEGLRFSGHGYSSQAAIEVANLIDSAIVAEVEKKY